jgi:hypothetical protein
MNASDANLIDLADAAKLVPHGSYHKVYRWCVQGILVGGLTHSLEYRQIGHRMYTSAEWVQQFVEAVDADARANRTNSKCRRHVTTTGHARAVDYLASKLGKDGDE